MAGISYIRFFAALLLLCPVLIALLHNLWRFINQPQKILFVATIAISVVGILMHLLIWIGMQNLIPPGWDDEFGVNPYIGFFVAMLAYGVSLVMSTIFMRSSS